MSKTYGVLSDFHIVDFHILIPAVKVLIDEGIDALVLNGDLFGESSGHKPQDYLASMLKYIGDSGIEAYVMPGSHEVVPIFNPIVEAFSKRYKNINNVLNCSTVYEDDHTIIFLPGSDKRAGQAADHGYSLETNNKTGIYNNKGSYIQVTNMNDIKDLVTDPASTLVFSHVPISFQNPENSVDVEEAWEVQQDIKIGEDSVPKGTLIAYGFGKKLHENGAPLELTRLNMGNEDLRKIFKELGITKNVSGHFHASAGNATDIHGNPVEEGRYVPSLFYNASCMDRFMAGMVSVEGNEIAYENIDLKKYITIVDNPPK